MNLDMPTLFIIFIMVDLLMLCMFAFAGKKPSPSNRLWTAGLLLHFFALVLILARGYAPAAITYILANILLCVAFVMMTMSIGLLLNYRATSKWLWLPVPFMLAGTSLLVSNLPMLLTMTGFLFALQFSVILYMLGSRWYAINSNGKIFIAASVFAVIMVFYFRSAWILTHEVTASMIVDGDIMLSLPYLVGIIATIGLSGGMLIVLRDRLGEQLRENEHFLGEIAANIPSIIFQYRLLPDGTSNFPYINQRVNGFGVSAEELAESSESIFAKIHPDDYADVQKSITESAVHFTPWNRQFRLWTSNGKFRWHEAKSNPEKLRDGSILWHGYMHDIQDMKETEDRIRHLAVHDGLTGLANRSLLESHVRSEIAMAERNQSNFFLLFLDLDNFKYINDRFGHGIGDRLLQDVAVRLNSTLRKSDFVARVGGDEFVILVRSVLQPEAIISVGNKLRAAVAEPYDIDGKVMKISVSIGASVYPDHGSDLIELERSADKAMFDSKRRGKNMITIYQGQTPPAIGT